ncbi:DUF6282 family protein [Aeromicrobium piscarium]|uniref:Cytosolic protein n=1 Tax=Aeromicrobium piscarium TaxID=2590901 RepID=A0A554SA28_9ACTN|nr:DUF6282 family protein [Aeromicrobium piscarium]TSD63201.1 cytosolic protein [Aeromicrobium piscarium]
MRKHPLLAGVVDLHVHSFPDLTQRSVSDLDMARLARDAGMKGFAIKSHYAPTAERAWLTHRVVPEVEVYGSIVLNHFVGGINAAAVEVFARSGGRLVFMPTSDSMNEADVLDTWPGDQQLPPYLKIKKSMRASGRLNPPISLLDEHGRVSESCRDVLSVAAEYDLVVSTGHISPVETMALVPVAKQMGVQRVVVSHPESPHIGVPLDDQLELVRQGAMIERCFAYIDGSPLAETAYDAVRRTGLESNIFSSDMGMFQRDDPVSGFARCVDLLLAAGFGDDDVRMLTATNPSALVGAVNPRLV